MLKVDKVPAPRALAFRVGDYLWGGLAGLGVSFVLLGAWQAASLSLGDFLLPAPVAVWERVCELFSNLKQRELEITFWRACIGVSVSLILGIICGLVAGYFRTAMAILRPLMTILLSMPPIVWIVMALFWFGFGNASVLFTIIVIVFPLTFASAAMGMASVEPSGIELFDAYRLGLAKKIRYLYVPHLTEYIISSIGVAVASGVRIVVMAELLGASDGVGARIADARTMLDTTTVLAYVAITIAFVAAWDYLITKPLEITLMPWRR